MGKLKPCPFCGEAKDLRVGEMLVEYIWSDLGCWKLSVSCKKCDASGPWVETEGEAKKTWNSRRKSEI